MLDTDVSSYIIKNRSAALQARMERLARTDLCVSVITRAELIFGVERVRHLRYGRPIVEQFLRRVAVLAWDESAADHYGVVRSQLEAMGQPIGELDTLIAAHALAVNAVLVTNNLRHFSRVPGLKIEHWN